MSDIPLLVPVEWLKEQMDNGRQDFLVVDASYDMIRDVGMSYKKVHIPGAIFFDLKECRDRSSSFRNTLAPPQDFAKFVGNLGIDNRAVSGKPFIEIYLTCRKFIKQIRVGFYGITEMGCVLCLTIKVNKHFNPILLLSEICLF